jgi:hypothetical protein
MIPDGMIQELPRRAGEKRRTTAANLARREPTDPRELLASRMQAGGLAFDEGRWLNAETSFGAALKAAEYFWPQNPFVAVALYFLSRTQQKLAAGRCRTAVSTGAHATRRPAHNRGSRTGVHSWVDLKRPRHHLRDRRSPRHAPSSNQDRLREAERLFQRALAIRENLIGPSGPDARRFGAGLHRLGTMERGCSLGSTSGLLPRAGRVGKERDGYLRARSPRRYLSA